MTTLWALRLVNQELKPVGTFNYKGLGKTLQTYLMATMEYKTEGKVTKHGQSRLLVNMTPQEGQTPE